MPTIIGPDGAEHVFPDETGADVIKRVMARHYGAPKQMDALPDNTPLAPEQIAQIPRISAEREMQKGTQVAGMFAMRQRFIEDSKAKARELYATEPRITSIGREYLNNLTMGFGPNIVARAGSWIGKGDPEALREMEREKLRQYEKEHYLESYLPATAGSAIGLLSGAEIAGAAPYVGSGLAAAGRAIESIPTGSTIPANIASWTARKGLGGAAIGAPLSAVGELAEEKPTLGGVTERAGLGAIAGAGLNVGMQGLGLLAQGAYRAGRGVFDRYIMPERGGAAAGQKDVARAMERAGVTPQQVADIQTAQQAAGVEPAPLLSAVRDVALNQGRPGGAHSMLELGRGVAGLSGEAGEEARVIMGKRLLNQPAEIAKSMATEDPAGRSFDQVRRLNETVLGNESNVAYDEARKAMADKVFNLSSVLDAAEDKFGDILAGRTTQASKLAEAINRFRLKPSPKDTEIMQNAVQQLHDLGYNMAEKASRGGNRGFTDALSANLAADINSVAARISVFVDPKRGSPPSAALISEVSNLIPRALNVWDNAGVKAKLIGIVNDLQAARTNSLRVPATRSVDQFLAARHDIDGMISSAKAAGDGSLAGRLQRFRKMVNENAHQFNPKLAKADERFSGASSSQDLIEMGRNMAMQAGERQDEVLRRLPKMTPAQRELIWQGVKKHFADMAANTRLTSAGEAGSAATANQFMANNIEQVIRATAPTPKRANAMLQKFRWHAQNTATYQDVLQGSRTAPMGEQVRALMLGPQMAADAVTGHGLGLAGHANQLLARKFAAEKSAQIMRTLMSTDPAMAAKIKAAGARIPYASTTPLSNIAIPAARGLADAQMQENGQ